MVALSGPRRQRRRSVEVQPDAGAEVEEARMVIFLLPST